ncbi:MAG: protein-L-isoaspartate(D-aspartate) O-methyltransferase [Thermoanaerobaculales bacterium]|nr:protein-L-isoaspartate(D-aspartate) O-methyltransferase [Thermoanaerobaculales bacterium]
MSDGWESRRLQMVEALRKGGIRDERVLAAMEEVPRHLFVAEAFRSQAYALDASLNIGEGQTISQTRVVAAMTAAAQVGPDDRVLEVGTGSGYQAAILARLARFVFTVERLPKLARMAKQRLDALGFENVSIKVMDGTLGWRSQGPYAAIVVTAGAPRVPELLVEQLTEGGRLVVPVGPRDHQVLQVVIRRGQRVITREIGNALFVPLVGRHGWEEEE